MTSAGIPAAPAREVFVAQVHSLGGVTRLAMLGGDPDAPIATRPAVAVVETLHGALPPETHAAFVRRAVELLTTTARAEWERAQFIDRFAGRAHLELVL